MIRSFQHSGSRLACAAAAAALLVATASPAEARPRDWGRRGGWHHRGGGTSFGDVVLGAAIIGGVAAVASSIANGSRDRDRDYDGGYEDNARWNGDRYDNGAPRVGGNGAPTADEDLAVERCADAAEREAGGSFRVRGIRYVDRDGAGWRIEGDLAEQRGYGQSFVCGVRSPGVDFVQLGEPIAAR